MKSKMKDRKGIAIIYVLFIIFVIFMLAMAIINVVEKTTGYVRSKERFAQRFEGLNLGTNLGWSYLTNLFNSSPSVLPDSNRLIADGYRNGRTISNFANGVQIRVFIFDQDVINSYWQNANGLNQLINDLRNNGVQSLINRDNTNVFDGEGAPYLILTEVTNTYRIGQGSRMYQISIINLENFNRFAYFTNVETTPSDSNIWFLAGFDTLTGPVHTNSRIVRISGSGSYYNSPFSTPIFNGPFSFRGNLTVTNNPPTDYYGFVLQGYTVNNAATIDNFFNKTFSNGTAGIKANSPQVSLPPDDPNDPKNTLRQVWPALIGNGGAGAPTSQRGIFVDVQNNQIVSGIYVRDTDNNNILSQLNLGYATSNGEVLPKYTFQFDSSGTYSTPVVMLKKNKDVVYNITKPSGVSTLKVKEITLSNGQQNLLDYLNNPNGYNNSSSYTIPQNEKSIVLAKIEGNTMYITKFNLPDGQTFPKGAIWVNGSIGEELGASNRNNASAGGLSGVAAEPITIIAKSSNQAAGNSANIKSIRINGSIVPYGVNPSNGALPPNDNSIVVGLYSEIVFVGRNAQLYTNLGGNNNGLYVYASILAMKDRPGNSRANYTSNQRGGYFMVEDYNSWTYNSNNILHVYGGIIQYFRGPVGTFNSATMQPSTGFKKDYRYDRRFAFLRPPLFPTTNRFVQLVRMNITFNL